MGTLVAISSSVAQGGVGLRVTVPALQALGHDTIALPAIILSSHLGYARVAGATISPETIEAMIEALDANGWLDRADAVLTGYLPSPEHVDVAAALVVRMRRSRPEVPFFCDPVLGDAPDGLYVPDPVAIAVRDKLVPLATYLKPNAFELGFLAGRPVGTVTDAVAAAKALDVPHVLASSIPAGDGTLANVLVSGGRAAFSTVAFDATAPRGTGDLLMALFAGRVLGTPPAALDEAVSRAVAGVADAIASSQGSGALRLFASESWHSATPFPLATVPGSGR